MFRFLVPAVAVSLLATAASAQTQNASPFSKSKISPIALEFRDLSRDMCWTDHAAAGDAAVDLLERVNLPVAEHGAKSSLKITVIAQRQRGFCYGAVSISHRGWVVWEGAPAFVSFTEPFVRPFSRVGDANEFVAQTVRQFATRNLATLPESGF